MSVPCAQRADVGEPAVTCDEIDSVTLIDELEPIPSVRTYRPSTTSLDLDELLRIESSTDDFEVQKAVQDEVRAWHGAPSSKVIKIVRFSVRPGSQMIETVCFPIFPD